MIRASRSESSALRSQAVAKGLMVSPWQPVRAYCCTLPAPCLATSHHPAWHIYLHVTWIRARLVRPHARKHACVPRPVPHGCLQPCACLLLVYASMPVVPNPFREHPGAMSYLLKTRDRKVSRNSPSLSRAKSGSFFFGKRPGVGTVRWQG